jgi:hypothetical protein
VAKHLFSRERTIIHNLSPLVVQQLFTDRYSILCSELGVVVGFPAVAFPVMSLGVQAELFNDAFIRRLCLDEHGN